MLDLFDDLLQRILRELIANGPVDLFLQITQHRRYVPANRAILARRLGMKRKNLTAADRLVNFRKIYLRRTSGEPRSAGCPCLRHYKLCMVQLAQKTAYYNSISVHAGGDTLRLNILVARSSKHCKNVHRH